MYKKIGVVVLVFLLSFINFSVSAEDNILEPDQKFLTASQQLDFLMSETYKDANEQILKTGSFYPYAAALIPDGTIKYLRLQEGERPVPALGVLALQRSLKAWADNKVVAATVYYVATDLKLNESGEPQRVMIAQLEHYTGESFARITPYSISNGEVIFEEGAQKPTDPALFTKK